MPKAKEDVPTATPVARVKKAAVSIDGTTLTIDFTDAGSVVLDATTLSKEVKASLLMHGLKQKICDSYSGIRGQEAETVAQAVADQLSAGNWAVVRQSSGGAVRGTLLAEAIARISGKALEEVTVQLAGLGESDAGKEQLKLLRQDAQVKRTIAEIKLEKATKESEGKESILNSVLG